MSLPRWAAVFVALAVLAPASPGASAADPGLTLVRTLTLPGAVSAKVIEEAGAPRWLYVSAASSFLVYDVADPSAPREVGRLPLGTYQNEDLDGSASVALLMDDVPVAARDSPAGGQMIVISTADKARPVPVAHIPLPDGAGHTATCLEQCRWAYVSGGASLVVVDLRVPATPVVHRLPFPSATGLIHDLDVDDQGLLWVSGWEGLAALAVRPVTSSLLAARTARATPLSPVVLSTTGAAGSSPAVAQGTLHGSVRPRSVAYAAASGLRPGDVVLAAEESTATDCQNGGRFHTFDARGLRTGQPLRLLDSVAPVESTASLAPGLGSGCSVHWFTQQGALVAAAWFGAGIRILDISDPRRVRQVGRYVPTEPRTWSAYWLRGTPYVYALDLHRGIDVLRVTARPGGPEVAPLSHGTRAPTSLAALSTAAWCQA